MIEGAGQRQRAALVTGASSGIGYAVAEVLGELGYALTITGRRPEKLADATAALQAQGLELQSFATNLEAEDAEEHISHVVEAHHDRFGRMDVLVNNAGIGMRGTIDAVSTKRLDAQLDVNLRATILFVRESLELLRAAGGEHRNALIVNVSSVAGKGGQANLPVYSAAKHGVVGFTQALNRQLASEGVKSCVFCPGFVDTPMVDVYKDDVTAEEMIPPRDIAEAVRYLLSLSANCLIPELVFTRPAVV